MHPRHMRSPWDVCSTASETCTAPKMHAAPLTCVVQHPQCMQHSIRDVHSTLAACSTAPVTHTAPKMHAAPSLRAAHLTDVAQHPRCVQHSTRNTHSAQDARSTLAVCSTLDRRSAAPSMRAAQHPRGRPGPGVWVALALTRGKQSPREARRGSFWAAGAFQAAWRRDMKQPWGSLCYHPCARHFPRSCLGSAWI